jgi:putative hydrolase of the HAD superfamily
MPGVKAVLFDFGGTLDADGTAWKERCYACYRAEGVDLDAECFARHFYAADDALVGSIPEATGLEGTVMRLVGNIEAGLEDGSSERGRRVAERFLADSRAVLARNAAVLARLAERYTLGVVSNFYGNLSAVCSDAGIAAYLRVMVDSVKVGAEKPSARIFRAALDAVPARADECVFVGDSLRRDREGARNIGMRFVWVASPAARPQGGAPAGERIVASVVQIEDALA